jgi:hypothetical protein
MTIYLFLIQNTRNRFRKLEFPCVVPPFIYLEF